MILMLVLVIPRLSTLLTESGQELPLYTKLVIGISEFFVSFGPFLFIFLAILTFFGWRYGKTESGRYTFDSFKLSIPYIGRLYQQLYLTRMAESLQTTITSGVPLIRAMEISAAVVGNVIYEDILNDALKAVKGGSSLSGALDPYPEIPGLIGAMVRVGEETGQLGKILSSLAKFYRREVSNSIERIVSLIEPALIILLAVGVGILLASILIPIYTISSSI
jgi:type IV pilus assembly protein PilC